MKKVLALVLLFINTSISAKTLPNLFGAWKVVRNVAVSNSDVNYSTDAGKEKSVRFTKMEFFFGF